MFASIFSVKKPEKFLQKSLVVKKKYLPLQSQTKTGCLVAQFSGIKKFIEKTELLYKKQVPRKTIYREALILLKRIISVRDKLRIIRNYTMKSLILAQDER